MGSLQVSAQAAATRTYPPAEAETTGTSGVILVLVYFGKGITRAAAHEGSIPRPQEYTL